MPKKNKCFVCQKDDLELLFTPSKNGAAIYLCEYCRKTYTGAKDVEKDN